MLDSTGAVIWSLLTYTDWWQPSTSSVLVVGAARRSSEQSDGIHPGLLETLDLRTELCRRVSFLEERERRLLFLWYVRQLPLRSIAGDIGKSGRQCQRMRTNAIRKIVELGRNSNEEVA